MERLSGPDALMLNMETRTTPMHTLKIAVIDTSRRGKPVSLTELVDILPRYLGRFPRSTQHLERLPAYQARPFWVRDKDFDIRNHLDEVTLPEPGGRAELDAVLAELAVRQLDRHRPLWALTLIHGVTGGRQAVVVRIHHAVADGLAALNTFMGATSEEGGVIEPAPIDPVSAPVDRRVLGRMAREESRRLLRAIPGMVGGFARAARIKSGTPTLPRPLTVPRNSFNTPSGAVRVCASGEIPLAAVQRIAVATETTVNGALHGVIAGAMRAELLSRGENPGAQVSVFGVCKDITSPRTWGNEIATASAYLRADLDDPVERVVRTAASCHEAVAYRRQVGFELTEKTSAYTGRLGPVFRILAAHRMPRVMNNITTANMPGPKKTRWVGDIEVVDWVSFALATAPADVNLTAYSYAGRITMGLVSTPESMPDPRSFLERVHESLNEVSRTLGLPESPQRQWLADGTDQSVRKVEEKQ